MLNNDKTYNSNINNDGKNNGNIINQNNGTVINQNHYYNTETSKQPKILTSNIPKLIQLFADNCPDEELIDINNFSEFKVPAKLDYNNIIKYKCIIEEYSIYYTFFDDIMNKYDNHVPKSKNKMLRCIHNWYLRKKGEIISEGKEISKSDIEKLQESADNILETIREKIIEVINNSNDTFIHEDLDFGVDCFICYCFMECKIFEKPPTLEN